MPAAPPCGHCSHSHTTGTLGLGGGVCAPAFPVCFQTVPPPPSAKSFSFSCHLAPAPSSLHSYRHFFLTIPSWSNHPHHPFNEEFDIWLTVFFSTPSPDIILGEFDIHDPCAGHTSILAIPCFITGQNGSDSETPTIHILPADLKAHLFVPQEDLQGLELPSFSHLVSPSHLPTFPLHS